MADPFKYDNVRMPWTAAANTVMTVAVSVLSLFYVAIELQKISLNTSTLSKILCQPMFLGILCIIYTILCHIASLCQ